MAVSQSYRDFVLEQLGPRDARLRKIDVWRGRDLCPGLLFALVAEDRLYFKVDDVTRPDFERRGMEPFQPFGEDSAMGYYEVPADIVEDVSQLETWMKRAIDVAAAAKGSKHKRSKR